jgi:hypothetical protein
MRVVHSSCIHGAGGALLRESEQQERSEKPRAVNADNFSASGLIRQRVRERNDGVLPSARAVETDDAHAPLSVYLIHRQAGVSTMYL